MKYPYEENNDTEFMRIEDDKPDPFFWACVFLLIIIWSAATLYVWL